MAESAALEALLAQAKKGGEWGTVYSTLLSASTLTLTVLNAVPTGRSFGVIHQLAYWGSIEGLQATLVRFPQLNLSLLTKQGQTPLQVAQENKRQGFVDFLSGLLAAKSAQAEVAAPTVPAVLTAEQSGNPLALELCEAAKNGKWSVFHDLLADEKKVDVSVLNVVPKGKRWGVVHQIAYWGKIGELDFVTKKFPSFNLLLETSETIPQTASDIAKGKGHKDFATALALNTLFVQQALASVSLSSIPAVAPAVEGNTASLSCMICLDEFPANTAGAICSVDKHFTCSDCFSAYVISESDISQNTSGILLKGGLLFCVAEKIKDGCKSPAFSNKLVAACVDEPTYDLYLKARDFVVGKDAAAKALHKVTEGLNSVEQEQIRNLFRSPDGSYRAYQCKNCKFGPVDHGWCSNLSSHNEEKKSGGGVIKNACPRCNWFAQDISQWAKWNGEFPPWNGVKIVKQLPKPMVCKGRPFSLSEGKILCSPILNQNSDWNRVAENLSKISSAPVQFDLLDAGRVLLTKQEAQAVGNRWAIDGIAEHASVASFARHTLELMAVGAPPEILVAAQRAGSEEVGHAQLCFALARKYGVFVEPGNFPLPGDRGSPSLLSMALGVASEGCVVEFGSCIAASWQLVRAKMPAVKIALQQIAREEAGHCVLAWRTLLWAVSKLRSQQNVQALTQLLESFQSALDTEQLFSDVEDPVLEELLTLLPEFGLLTAKEEAHARVETARCLTQQWVKAVMQERRPPAPTLTDLSALDPSLFELASRIHQAVFYNEPL